LQRFGFICTKQPALMPNDCFLAPDVANGYGID
jgi:hypothetical protein